VPLADRTWDSYLATVGSAHRANFRRRFRALEREFRVGFECATSESQRQAALQTLIDLHNRRWDKRGGSTAFPTPACRAFHDEATRLALESGWLRLFELRLNDVAVAATYCFGYNGRFYFYQGAFDERYQKYSVGLVTMGLTIRAAIAEGAIDFDLLYGEESYKWLWARETRTLERLELFPAHIGGRLHQRTVEARRTVRALARRIFPRKPCDSNIRPAGAVC
jgi:CelD/BcsL family acetyltransferase involved in cellulose biosynthesis